MSGNPFKLTEILHQMLNERLNSQDLRSSSGRKIGRITVDGTKATLQDSSGRKLGTYDTKDNQTRDATGRKIGEGNILGTLLGTGA